MVEWLERLLTSEPLTPIILGLVVFLFALARFQKQPPPPRASSAQPSSLARLRAFAGKVWLRGEKSRVQYLPPSRANTTWFRFWLYRTVYASSAVLVFVFLYKVPGLREVTIQVIEWAGGTDANLESLGSLALAFVIAGFAPPPVRGIEESVRRYFYERAMIDARLLREIARLKEAAFKGEDLIDRKARTEEGGERKGGLRMTGEAETRVWTKLEPEGFERADLAYNPASPTAQSMWMKASLLMEHINLWETDPKYMHAFQVLQEGDGTTRSIDALRAEYDGLKVSAKACLARMREAGAGPEPDACSAFRQDCQELLKSTYSLLARVSLIAHVSDKERIERMGDIGFELKPSPKGPLPDADDLAWLGVLLGFFVLLPIGVLMGELVRPLVITFIYLATVLTPVVMAHALPNFAMRRGGQRPAIAFPLSVGVVVVAIQLVLGFTFLLEGSLGERLDAFSSTAFPWTVFTFVISVLLALRMRIGAYPDLGTLQAQPWRQWGDLRDGLWLATFGAAVTILFFAPRLFEAPSGSALKMLVGQLTIPPVIAFVLGFLVPTWYRAKLKAKDEARAVPQGSPTGTETPATT